MKKKIFLIFLVLIAVFVQNSFGAFELKDSAENPFRDLNQSQGFFEAPVRTSLALGDLMGDDGNLEAVIGSQDQNNLVGTIRLFSLNLSTGFFEEEANSPLLDFGEDVIVTPTLFDWNDDGELDLFVGVYDPSENEPGKILYYSNAGSASFSLDNQNNPFSGVTNLGICKVAIADFSTATAGNEAIVGTSNGNGVLRYFVLVSGIFVEDEQNNPINYSISGDEPKPFALFDDSDGNIDLLVGTVGTGNLGIRLYRNEGTENAPSYPDFTNIQILENEQLKDLQLDTADPVIVNFDGDNQRDLFVGTNNIQFGILYLEELPRLSGDYDGDKDVDLTDAVIALKILSGILPPETLFPENEVSGDGAIGVEEAIFALRKVAGL